MNIEFNPPLNMTLILLFLLFVAALIYIRITHCYCGMHINKCKCHNRKKKDIYEGMRINKCICHYGKYEDDVYEGATGSIGQVSLTPFQSQIPLEIPRPISSTGVSTVVNTANVSVEKPEAETTQTLTATSIPSHTSTPTPTPTPTPIPTPTSIPTSIPTHTSAPTPTPTRSQKENIQKPKFNWSTDHKVNEELRQQVIKDIEITKQKDINIIQTKPGTIKNIKITPETNKPYVQPSPPPITAPVKKPISGWILFAIFGGIWCLMVIIFIIIMIAKYRKI